MRFFKPPFMKLPTNKQFEYIPRYYDPEKEKRENRRKIKMERGSFYRHSKSPLLQSVTQRNERHYRRTRQKGGQFARILLLTAMLSLVVMYILGVLSGIVVLISICVMLFFFLTKLGSV